tara:strand:- start:959 stop:1450 length:492 start_codon:yes stop_codon:yes gene_type:complete
MFVEFSKISSQSPIWIFQANKMVDVGSIKKIEDDTINFLNSWTSHDFEIKSSFKILYNLFLIISVESDFSRPSGCSIDKLINFVKEINKLHNIDFLNRLNISYRNEDMIEVVNITQFKKLILDGLISKDTIVFNNTIRNKGELNKNWETKALNSWHKKYFNVK